MPASAVSAPTASTRTRSAESVATVPATTRSPTVRGTGRDSPVIIDSSSSARPSATGPPAGLRPPGPARPVGGHPPAGCYEHAVSGLERGIRHHLERAGGPDPLGVVGQELGER